MTARHILLAGGIGQALVFAWYLAELKPPDTGTVVQSAATLIQGYHALVLLAIGLFTYLSLARWRDLAAPPFGRVLSGSIAVFYFAGAIRFPICLVLVFLYAAFAFNRPRPSC